MGYSSILPADEEVVHLWLDSYSGELFSLGINLGLTPAQEIILKDSLLSILQRLDAMASIKRSFQVDRPKNEPTKLSWLNERKPEQHGPLGAV